MNNLKYNVMIGIVLVFICAIITLTNGVNFFFLFIPMFFIIVMLWLSSLLKKRFGSSHGIAFLLFLICIIPVGWYYFSANLPMTRFMMDDNKKSKDLLSFKEYFGAVDAKKEIAEYQIKQDSILRQTVSELLSQNLIVSALTLVRQNQIITEKIKRGLFTTDSIPRIKTEPTARTEGVSENLSGPTNHCGNYPESSFRKLTQEDISGRSPDVLRLMRNEIFMRHNYIFSSLDLINYAQSFPCYQPINSNIESFLTDIEKENIELISEYEQNGEAKPSFMKAMVKEFVSFLNQRING
ncbi:MAG TPA: hypothetical protein DCY06_09625 [Bacteroidetes bacterium]|nr:hypothetical protein [Bacteroidota bacterium]HRK00678.1 YARHG domain-containing protein [Ignavibacteria bacterium]